MTTIKQIQQKASVALYVFNSTLKGVLDIATDGYPLGSSREV